VYPLIFEPIFKPKIWGGRRLEELLRKPLPGTEPIGEAWEIADLEENQSVVVNGPARGRQLGELVRSWGRDLIGSAPLFAGRFPLLIKFLDARDTLSVQVHPDEAMARRLGGRTRVKNEAWYVLDAREGGFIYRGVRQGVDAETLRRAIEEKRVEDVLHRIEARKGHCYYLPSGTIHALGAGVAVAEVQTPSDVTYRVYDWDRVDPSTGRPRNLHLAEALQCVSLDTRPISGETPEHIGNVWTAVTRLVRSESFVIERVRMIEGVDQPIHCAEFVIWIVLEGRGNIACDCPASPVTFGVGDTVLLPAGMDQARVQTHEDCMWLEVSIPIPGAPLRAERRPGVSPMPPDVGRGESEA
jgi:mannose-6-phosphate isomerase